VDNTCSFVYFQAINKLHRDILMKKITLLSGMIIFLGGAVLGHANVKISEPVYTLTTTLEQVMFPEIQPYNEGHLKVSDIHQIWYAEYGNPKGVPVVVVHGGPGAGSTPRDMRFFDPKFYRIILFDQRSSGKSIPSAEMKDNTPQHSIADMEALRTHLGVDKWVVFGGSWGSTLSIIYGQAHPEKCLGFIVRGVFLGRQAEYEQLWYGMGDMYPEAYGEVVEYIPESERSDLISAFYKRLMDPDPAVHMPAARAFCKFDFICATLLNKSQIDILLKNDKFVLSLARGFTHYSMNKFFFEPNQVVDNLNKISHLPATIVHGRYDVICRPKAAYELHTKWPGSKMVFVSDAGHATFEPGMFRELVAATEEMKSRLR
jgi:proline iminopeptidase